MRHAARPPDLTPWPVGLSTSSLGRVFVEKLEYCRAIQRSKSAPILAMDPNLKRPTEMRGQGFLTVTTLVLVYVSSIEALDVNVNTKTDPCTLQLLFCVGLVFYRLYLSPLSKFPGPKINAISRLPYLVSTVKGTIVSDLVKLHEQYGEVVRIAPHELSFNTPEAAKTIYQSNPEMPKDAMHLPPFHNGAPGILAADKEHHSRYRRLLAYGFSDKGMRAQQPLIQRHIDLLIRRLRERSGKDSLDMVEWFNWCTFDIVSDKGALAWRSTCQIQPLT